MDDKLRRFKSCILARMQSLAYTCKSAESLCYKNVRGCYRTIVIRGLDNLINMHVQFPTFSYGSRGPWQLQVALHIPVTTN